MGIRITWDDILSALAEIQSRQAEIVGRPKVLIIQLFH